MDKIQDVVRSFDGCGNIDTWLKKFKLVAKLKEVKKLESFLPLFLEGDAFSVYDELSETSKDSSEKIKQALLNAFAQNQYSAYDSFRQRSWTPGEAVDVYMSDLRRRLSRLSKIESDDVIRCAFIFGLPADVSSQLRVAATINTMELSAVVEQARVLMSDRLHGAMAVHAKHDETRSTGGISASRSSHRADDSSVPSSGDRQQRYQQQQRRVIVWFN